LILSPCRRTASNKVGFSPLSACSPRFSLLAYDKEILAGQPEVTDESEVFYVRKKLDRQVLSAETVAEHADNGQAHREHDERRLGRNGADSALRQ
jgi:hypothetical protein